MQFYSFHCLLEIFLLFCMQTECNPGNATVHRFKISWLIPDKRDIPIYTGTAADGLLTGVVVSYTTRALFCLFLQIGYSKIIRHFVKNDVRYNKYRLPTSGVKLFRLLYRMYFEDNNLSPFPCYCSKSGKKTT